MNDRGRMGFQAGGAADIPVMVEARLIEVSKRYGRRWALVRLSLTIPAKSSVLLTGPNGAGKTTLLRVLATALKPTRGEVWLGGVEARGSLEAVRHRVELITHQTHLYDDLSAEENLRLLPRFDREVDGRRIPAVLERVGLAARTHSPARTFSAGMRRRLALARALLRRPGLVLLDEPFTQLDPEGVALMEDVIRELCASQVTLVMSTHDVERGRALCDQHLHMVAGCLAGPLAPTRRAGAAGVTP